MKIRVELDNPKVLDRAAYWWERCLVRILHSGDPRAQVLRKLVSA